MESRYKKYIIIIPLGIVLFFLLGIIAILVWPDTISTGWQWWLISAFVILPMWYLGIHLDKKVFKVKGTLLKVKEKGKSLAVKAPDQFMKCPHCGMSVKIGSEYCGYCAEKVQ